MATNRALVAARQLLGDIKNSINIPPRHKEQITSNVQPNTTSSGRIYSN